MEQKFEFKGNLVRMKTDESEQYWFAGIDVCNILGLENPTQSVESLDEDEKKLDYILDSSGQQRKTWTINEFGLYSLVLKSRKPEAREFKRWITHEVLPAIRKAGRYTTDQERDREEAILKMTGKLRSLTVEKEELQRKLNEKRKIIEKTSIQLMQLLESDFRQFKLPFAD
ncbi:BRO-N domain-containing protein [Butyricimonas virosa]|jgi:toxin-antitoxin system, toxin component, bro family|uniref:BRO-N domain-containing protein n=1 Tax=Butyricimonas virosa TaxID=544645 RepID=UPI00204A405F|nr:BRO family protein [Butyricimonas virosa]DAT44635.1 MAG TPA: repressor domain protein [Caudoviricetes sp.]